jgi:3-oxoacyl-[acyl-carrier-protein] synthase II
MKRRIVVTGMGVASCFGNDVDVFHQSLLEGKSGIVPITSFPCDEYSTRFAGVIQNFDAGEYIDKKQARRVDPFIAYGMVAGKKALEYGNLYSPDALGKLDKTRCGVIIGSGMGGMRMLTDGVNTIFEKGYKRLTPFFIPYILTNMGGALLAMDLGFMGPNYSISTACASGNHSIIAAANHILRGEADLMLCGGSEAAICPIGLAGFCAIKALSQRNDAPQEASRPWDRNRDGFVMGEGAGVLLLESLEHALARGATIYAEYLGGNVSCDAYHMTEPREDGEGIALCLRRALSDSGITPDQVNYINAHATSTPLGDVAEINALKKVIPDPSKVRINATKSMIGHLLGGAGGMEAVVTVKTVETGQVHPTINLKDPEPNLGFQIPTQAEECDVNVAISNSFGFGGHNASIVLAAYRP